MDVISGDAAQVSGRVKWFDQGRGFGFILSDEGGPDILLHGNVLRAFGRTSVVEGARIEVHVQMTPRGAQAVDVISIEPPEPADPESSPILAELQELDHDGPLCPARVKWFDRGKGFGFANVFGSDVDVFIHAEVLRLSGFAELQTGEAVAVRVADGRRGKLAVEVAPWEHAMSES
jgi:CspA family cold shock protein